VISFVTWLWAAPAGYRSTFDATAVNTLFAMIDRHYPSPHRNICVTKLSKGIHSSIEVVPDREDFAGVTNPNGRQNPSCYRRLRVFAPEAEATFGPRVVSLDLDMVIVGDLRPLVDRSEDFIVWGQSDFPKRQFYNGSLWMLRTGSRPQVWTRFDPRLSPHQSKRAGHRGSDQGWLSYVLGPKEATWGEKDGVYSWRVHLAPKGGALPANAKVVCFHGKTDPWSYEMSHYDWIREHYVDHQLPALR
jgi:hypothetical protein